MKNFKKIICLCLTAIVLLSMTLTAGAYYAVTMYAPDGRTINVWNYEVDAYKAVGWSLAEVVTMYAPDGRTINVWSYEVDAYKAVGWSLAEAVTMYAPDGRTIRVFNFEVPAYESVGWYSYPVVTMYAPDGRTVVVAAASISSWERVGWYTHEDYLILRSPQYSYPGTNIPDYTYVTGIELNDIYYGDDGIVIYRYPFTYYGDYYDMVDYVSYLWDSGFWLDDEEQTENSIEYYFTNGTYYVGVAYFAEYDEVWIGIAR